MTITREQVADLQPGDVVEMTRNSWPDGTVVRGALYEASDWLYVAEEAVRGDNGRWVLPPGCNLTVVSRAPRRLYVNHPRTEPVPGDVVRDADDDGITTTTTWFSDGQEPTLWCALPGLAVWDREDMPDRLRLLVDGETGQVVPE